MWPAVAYGPPYGIRAAVGKLLGAAMIAQSPLACLAPVPPITGLAFVGELALWRQDSANYCINTTTY